MSVRLTITKPCDDCWEQMNIVLGGLYWDSHIVAVTSADSCGNYELSTDTQIPVGTSLLKIVSSSGETARVRYTVGTLISRFVVRLVPVGFRLNTQPAPDLHLWDISF